MLDSGRGVARAFFLWLQRCFICKLVVHHTTSFKSNISWWSELRHFTSSFKPTHRYIPSEMVCKKPIVNDRRKGEAILCLNFGKIACLEVSKEWPRKSALGFLSSDHQILLDAIPRPMRSSVATSALRPSLWISGDQADEKWPIIEGRETG